MPGYTDPETPIIPGTTLRSSNLGPVFSPGSYGTYTPPSGTTSGGTTGMGTTGGSTEPGMESYPLPASINPQLPPPAVAEFIAPRIPSLNTDFKAAYSPCGAGGNIGDRMTLQKELERVITSGDGCWWDLITGTTTHIHNINTESVNVGTETWYEEAMFNVLENINTDGHYRLDNLRILDEIYTSNLRVGHYAGNEITEDDAHDTFVGYQAGLHASDCVANTIVGAGAGTFIINTYTVDPDATYTFTNILTQGGGWGNTAHWVHTFGDYLVAKVSGTLGHSGQGEFYRSIDGENFSLWFYVDHDDYGNAVEWAGMSCVEFGGNFYVNYYKNTDTDARILKFDGSTVSEQYTTAYGLLAHQLYVYGSRMYGITEVTTPALGRRRVFSTTDGTTYTECTDYGLGVGTTWMYYGTTTYLPAIAGDYSGRRLANRFFEHSGSLYLLNAKQVGGVWGWQIWKVNSATSVTSYYDNTSAADDYCPSGVCVMSDGLTFVIGNTLESNGNYGENIKIWRSRDLLTWEVVYTGTNWGTCVDAFEFGGVMFIYNWFDHVSTPTYVLYMFYWDDAARTLTQVGGAIETGSSQPGNFVNWKGSFYFGAWNDTYRLDISKDAPVTITDGTASGLTIVGAGAGTYPIRGNKNSLFGYNTQVGSPEVVGSTAIGADAIVYGSNTIVLGTTGTNQPDVVIGATIGSGRLFVYQYGDKSTDSFSIRAVNEAENSTYDGLKKYGVYISCTGTFTGSSGTATENYGLYVAAVTGADQNVGIYSGSSMMIGDTADTEVTLGLVLNQGANDDAILAFKSSDVAHGITDYNETDTYAAFYKASATEGGVNLRGLSEATVCSLVSAYYTTDVTTKLATSNCPIGFRVAKKSGTGRTDPGANATLVGIRAWSASGGDYSTKWLCDAEGDTWQTGSMESSIVTGTAPVIVASTTVCTNLNADMVDGYHASSGGTLEPTGFVNRTSSTLSWSDVDRTLTITGTNFKVWRRGVEYTLNTDTCQIPDTSNFYYFYYTTSGATLDLTYDTTFPGFDVPLVATVYWNTTAGMDKGLCADERHGCAMDWATHEWAHETIGVRYGSGLTGTFLDATFTITAGDIHDEDLEYSITQQTTCNVLYKDGSTTWKWTAAQAEYYYTSGGNIYYNNGTTLTAATANKYVAYWIFATNDLTTPIVSIIGQRQDTTIADARLNNRYEDLTFGTLPFLEMKLLYRVICHNDPTPWVETLDMRAVSNISSGTFVSTAHNALTGLTSGDDHTQYAYCKIHATDSPGADDDITNYREGTVWIEQDSNTVWICADNTDTAAVWHGLDQDLRTVDSPTFAGLTLGAFAGIIKGTAGVLSDSAVLNDLGDVNAGAPNDEDALTWDAGTSKWIPAAIAGGAAHALLSATHNDTTASAVTQGSIIVGDGTPKWVELAVGTVGQVLTTDGTDVYWDDPPAAAAHDILSATHGDTAASAVSRGSLIYGNNTPKWAELVIGGAGTILTSDGTDVSWASPATHALLSASHSDTTASAVSQGSIIIGDATPKWVELAVGTNGQVLSTDGTDVFWDDPPAAAAHALLSATHNDTTASAVSRGSVIVGDSSPKWVELAIGDSGKALTSDGTDAAWGYPTPAAHNLLAAATHGDSVNQTVSRGSLVYGNSTPKWDELVIGAAGTWLYSDGTDVAWSTHKTSTTTITNTGATNWSKVAGCTQCLVRLWAGGGSGGRGGAGDGGGGGGGGGFIEKFFLYSELSDPVSVTVGAGGAAQSSDDTAGNVGGNTTFGAYLTAYGGGGGGAVTSVYGGGGGGGTASVGSVGSGTAGGAGGGPAGGYYTASTGVGRHSAFGGGCGGGAGPIAAGDSGWGGGGGGGGTATTGNGAGGASLWGGGGGGGGSDSGTGSAGGASVFGGAGGAGGQDAAAGTGGTQPGGGGGGSESANSGKGGDGQAVIISW